METTEKKKINVNIKKIIIPAVIVLAAVIVALNSFVVVEAGHTGVVVTMGAVNEGVLQEGIHLKAPFVQDVVKIDNRIQKLEVNTEAFSKDLQSVKTVLAINYRVDTAKSYSIYKNIGADYENVLVVPAVNEVLKAITSQYTAEESVTNRVLISDGLIEGLNKKLNDLGLYITDVNIIDFDFSEAFITAIEEKQVAQQQHPDGLGQTLGGGQRQGLLDLVVIVHVAIDEQTGNHSGDGARHPGVVVEPGLGHQVHQPPQVEQHKGQEQIEEHDEPRRAHIIGHRGGLERHAVERAGNPGNHHRQGCGHECHHRPFAPQGQGQHLMDVPHHIDVSQHGNQHKEDKAKFHLSRVV